jgi:ABC-type uncharacterized transport system substrate-binding protein
MRCRLSPTGDVPSHTSGGSYVPPIADRPPGGQGDGRPNLRWLHGELSPIPRGPGVLSFKAKIMDLSPGVGMRRRNFITLLGSAAVWPLAARAQQPEVPVVGWLNARSPDDAAHLVAAFRRGLGEAGFIEGQNVMIEYRWALGQYDRLPAMAAELVRRPVTVLASAGGEPAALAAKAATSTIPIVFVIGGDPVKLGLAASLNRPGGNSTGISVLTNTLEPKRLELLRELVPRAETIGVLLNPNFPTFESQLRDLQEAARAINLQIHVLRASTDREIDAAFETVAQRRIPALYVAADAFFDTRRDKLVVLAVRHAVPTMYHFREFAAAGGLVSYGVDISDAYRLLGVYTGRILKGAKPADLPVRQPTKFELVINLKTARALGLEVPSNLSARANEVIE